MMDLHPGLMLSGDLPLRELAGLVELAEALGYGELWYSDQRFQRDCYTGLAVAAHHSKRLLLGPGVSDPYTRHPAIIATAIATLDELSDGRAQLGLGVGGSGFAQMRLARPRPVRALREAIEMVRAMLAGETVRYSGELFQLQDARLGFRPLRAQIPIHVVSHGAQVLRLCGRMADGVLIANMARREAIEEAIALVREGERAAGRPPGSVAVNLRLEACISDDVEPAMAAMKRRFAARLAITHPRWDYLERLGIQPSPEMRAAGEAGDAAAIAACLSDGDMRATALVGPAEVVAAQLRSLLTPEVARVTIRPYGFSGQGIEATVRAFAERVWHS